MKNWPHRKLRGKVDIREVDFPALKGNPLGDPSRRPVIVYLPQSYERERKKIPCVVALSAFLGTGTGFLNREPLAMNLIEYADQLMEKGIPSFVLVCADGFTRYGGSQYLDSTGTGRYASMIVRDLLPWVRQEYKVGPETGIIGKSSGGYGALTLAMKYPGVFQAVACHSGDLYFEWCYKPDFPAAAQVLRERGSVRKFFSAFDSSNKPSAADFAALNTIAMSSCYSPSAASKDGFEIPFNPATGELRERVWEKWLEHDPVYLAEKHAKNLKKLKFLFLDCGNRDEHFLHLGGRIFSERLDRHRVRHTYEEFPDGHRGTAYRYSASLPLLAGALRKK